MDASPPGSFEEESSSQLAKAFPLQPTTCHNFTIGPAGREIAFYADESPLLAKRLIASAVATDLGLSSVDYTLKRYVKEEPDPIGERVDVEISSFIRGAHGTFNQLVFEISHHDDGTLGVILLEWVLFRQEFSALQLLTMAERGSLIEGLTIARTQLEQLAWACSIDGVNDLDRIKSTKAQQTIANLKSIDSRVGKLYGHLSKYSHWSYEAQIQHMSHDGGKLNVVFASVEHKIHLYEVALLLLHIMCSMVLKVRKERLLLLEGGEEKIGLLQAMQADIVEMVKHLRASSRSSVAEADS